LRAAYIEPRLRTVLEHMAEEEDAKLPVAPWDTEIAPGPA
jgi:hypothetical protein